MGKVRTFWVVGILVLAAVSLNGAGVIGMSGESGLQTVGNSTPTATPESTPDTTPTPTPTPDTTSSDTGSTSASYVGIQYSDHSARATAHDGSYAEVLQIDTRDDDTARVGDRGNHVSRIVRPQTNAAVVVAPESGVGAYNATGVTFLIYDGTGQIRAQPKLKLELADGSSVRIDASVTGDRDLFVNDRPFAAYGVRIVADDSETVIGETATAVHGIGYEGQITQNSTSGTVELTLDRSELVDVSWPVEYRVSNQTGTVLTKDVDNVGGAETFTVTVDGSRLANGTYYHAFEVYDTADASIGDRLLSVYGSSEGPNNLTIASSSSNDSEPTPEPTPAPPTATDQCVNQAPFMYQGGPDYEPRYCSVLGNTTQEGNLRVLVADGLLGTQRYSDGDWQNQFYTYSGAVLSLDGEMVSLGYYNNQPDPTGTWGSLTEYQPPETQFVS